MHSILIVYELIIKTITMNPNNYCIIMAGGVGSRFWPLSKKSKPKQFLDILGIGKTLVQQTFERFIKICPIENIFIVTSKEYAQLVFEQLPMLLKENVLLEPLIRNTAPCIAYASYKIHRINPDANVVVAPSDHLILDEAKFLDIVTKGLSFVDDRNALLTLGIHPNRPETGYGYIQINPDIEVQTYDDDIKEISKVKTFTEKPNPEMAKVFFDSGEFFWNAGIFIWTLSSIITAFKVHLPEINTLFSDGVELYNTAGEEEYVNRIYPQCKNISIDYGVMEKAENVYVLCADFGWSDLGTWGSLYENTGKDANNNVVIAHNAILYDTSNCVINFPDDKLLVVQGLKDYIIVESNNTLLICPMSNEQQIKQFVHDVKIQKGGDYI